MEDGGSLAKERIKRLLIVLVVGSVTFFVARGIIEKARAAKDGGSLFSEQERVLGDTIGSLGEQMLGKVGEVVPFLKRDVGADGSGQVAGSQTKMEVNPEKIIETQTQKIIETIKQLPEEQIAKIKRQIFEQFCEEVLREE